MKIFSLLSFFTLIYFIAYSQEAQPSLIDSTITMEIPEEVKSAWKEYSALKLGMIKSIKFGKDSSEKYYIDKKSGSIAFIVIHKRLSKRKVELIYLHYLNSQLLKESFLIREQSNLGIWINKGYGAYIFFNDKQVAKKEKNFIPLTENSMLLISNRYFLNALNFLKSN